MIHSLAALANSTPPQYNATSTSPEETHTSTQPPVLLTSCRHAPESYCRPPPVHHIPHSPHHIPSAVRGHRRQLTAPAEAAVAAAAAGPLSESLIRVFGFVIPGQPCPPPLTPPPCLLARPCPLSRLLLLGGRGVTHRVLAAAGVAVVVVRRRIHALPPPPPPPPPPA